MSINRQQKNIINPYVLEDIDYNFTTSKRNLFVISAIHEYYIQFFNFLPQGKELKLSVQELESLGVEKETPNLIVTEQDLRAYSFLYPQNCNLVEEEGVVTLELIGDELANQKLSQLVIKLDQRGQLDLYTTNSSPTAILPENINNESPAAAVSRLIAILPFHSSEYKRLIYKSIDEDQPTSLDDYQSIEQLSLSVVASSYVNTDENVDIYDWRANCEPGTETSKTYYNNVDDKFYYTMRTDLASSQLFDQGYWTQQGRENAGQEMISAIKEGISDILKSTGRYSPTNLNRILAIGVGEPADDRKINFLSHLDVRPGSRWIYAVRISREIVETIPVNNDVFVSYDEFELTPLQRAEVLLDPEKNKTSKKSVIKTENLVVHIPRVVRTFQLYANQLDEENILPEDLQGIDLQNESRILDGFIDDLSLACIYNKVRLDDEDIIEFCFSDSFDLEYFTYNGYLMTRGIGNINFYPQSEEEEGKPRNILNTFSDSTPTTFSAIDSSQRIYNDYGIVDEENLKPWLDFFRMYLFPSIELSAEKIRQKAASSRTNARRNRRKNIFTKVSELAREGKDIEDFYRRINKSRNPYYQIGRAISSLDCDTGQADLFKNVLKTWQILDSKTSIRSKIRQAILILRDEIVKDSVTRAYLTQAIRAEENPQLFIRDIEKQINEQIFCSLDVLGNVIETSFLDPKDMNPTQKASGATPASKSGSPFKVELKIPKGYKGDYKTLFAKDSELYEELIIKIVSAYFKSVIVGIGKDVIKATLGCGPEDNRSDVLDDALRDLKYGLLDLNQYVDDLDLIDIAKSVDLVNVSRENVDGTEQVTKTDPTDRQLTALITDVSYMCTPRELDQLLFGSAQNVLYELILETVNDGVITFPINSDIDANGDDDVVTRTIDPSVYGSFEFTKEKIKDFFIALGDALRDEDIEDIAQLNISPLDAYCSNLDPDLGLERLGFRISPDQLEAQYASIAEDKINKINALCDWLKDLENILQGLEDLINNIPIMKQYEELLQFIADVSNLLWNSLTEWWSELWGEEIDNDSSVVYNLYLTMFGKDLYYTVRNIISTRIMVAQINRATDEEGFSYTAPSPSRYGRVQAKSPVLLPYPAPATIDDNGSWWWLGPLDNIEARPKDYESSYALRTSPQTLRTSLVNVPVPNPDREDGRQERRWDAIYDTLNDYLKASYKTFGPDQWVDDNITNNAKTSMSIENLSNGGVQVTRIIKNPDGTKERKVIAQYVAVPDDIEQSQESVDYYKMMTSIGPELLGGQITEGPRRQIVMPSRNDALISQIIDNAMFGFLYRFPIVGGGGVNVPNVESESLSVSNPTQYIDQQIDFSFANDQGKSRMKQYLRGTNRPLYQPNDENCVTNKEVAIANAIVLSIQARLQRFFMNTVSMASAYPHWNSFGTKKLVVDYLFRKVYDDLDSRGLSNIMFEYSDVLKRVYVDNPDNRLEELNTRTPKEYIKSLVEKVYSSMLDSVSDSVYSSLNTSPYSRSTTRNRYQGLIKTFYERILEGFQTVTNDQTYDIYGFTGQQQIERAQNFVTNVLLDQDGEPTEEGFYYGAYYFPIGFMIGQYLITYDSLINIVRNFKSGHMRSLVEIANADDAILSAIAEQEITKYSSRHIGFPYTVVSRSQGILVDRTFYSTPEVSDRLSALSIQTGIDAETFEQHLQYIQSLYQQRINDNLEALAAQRDRIPGVDPDSEDGRVLLGQIDFQIRRIRAEIYDYEILTDFVTAVLDGSVVPLEQALLSRLSWFSLGEEDVPLLQNAYGQFFENYVSNEYGQRQGFDHSSVENIIRRLARAVTSAYASIFRQDLLQEKNELENIFRL